MGGSIYYEYIYILYIVVYILFRLLFKTKNLGELVLLWISCLPWKSFHAEGTNCINPSAVIWPWCPVVLPKTGHIYIYTSIKNPKT